MVVSIFLHKIYYFDNIKTNFGDDINILRSIIQNLTGQIDRIFFYQGIINR